jgi:hypothetical protein
MARSTRRAVDEGPSAEDIARFSEQSAHCPECGAEIWDQADICPKCYSYLAGHTSSRAPTSKLFRQKWVVVVTLLVIVAFLMVLTPGGSQLFRILLPATP